MRLTKQTLKRIITEEIKSALKEVADDETYASVYRGFADKEEADKVASDRTWGTGKPKTPTQAVSDANSALQGILEVDGLFPPGKGWEYAIEQFNKLLRMFSESKSDNKANPGAGAVIDALEFAIKTLQSAEDLQPAVGRDVEVPGMPSLKRSGR